ncbi:serine/threonine-protein phosphatase pp2a-related [Anaeramoeba ignava]|uniref:Serine/threonine-protein phosphatase n=1 Tax=Anaeramoeba ignava TaxID=1746090 RepID=A0A9Q0LF29_ANAIG|nr:serine/threonine-protein phosphatase pp2a-related [Anaeramoeba ignava]
MQIDWCLEKLTKNPPEYLPENHVRFVCDKLKEILVNETNIAHVKSPITVVGDIHGQYYDLIELFKIGGEAPDTNFLFLGDFVDRGHYSVETISLLVCLKIKYPQRITLLRGNHESRCITQVYGFYEECTRKYGNINVWTLFTDLFDYLQLSAIIDKNLFCIHAGLSPSVQSVEQIKILDRFQEIPPEGALADLVWSDPELEKPGFSPSQRGAGYMFGKDIVERFLKVNKFDKILRSHQLCMEGYQTLFGGKFCTVWSAPNYYYRCRNVASILEIYVDNEDYNFKFNVFGPAPDEERVFPKAEIATNTPDYFK